MSGTQGNPNNRVFTDGSDSNPDGNLCLRILLISLRLGLHQSVEEHNSLFQSESLLTLIADPLCVYLRWNFFMSKLISSFFMPVWDEGTKVCRNIHLCVIERRRLQQHHHIQRKIWVKHEHHRLFFITAARAWRHGTLHVSLVYSEWGTEIVKLFLDWVSVLLFIFRSSSESVRITSTRSVLVQLGLSLTLTNPN